MESKIRERIIDFIEGKTGTLKSVSWSLISTRDLIILQITLNNGTVTSEYWQYMNREED